eukprot:scaffold52683_cov69-Phaeocystis_antarctica.AAC.6
MAVQSAAAAVTYWRRRSGQRRRFPVWMRVATRAAERLSRLGLEPQATATPAPRVEGAASRRRSPQKGSPGESSSKSDHMEHREARGLQPARYSFICHQITTTTTIPG